MRILVRALLGAVVITSLAVAPVAATHSGRHPTTGYVQNWPKNTVLGYGYAASTYPAWVYNSVNGVLTGSWAPTTTNNSDMPTFSNTGTGGIVTYLAQSASPCGSGRTDWLQCSSSWTSTAWHLYVRNLNSSGYDSFVWYDDNANSCPASTVCFYSRRSVVHEALHIAIGIGSHDDTQDQNDTVMSSAQPSASTPGWNSTTPKQCDTAAAQIAYDVSNTAWGYPDCYLNFTTEHGPTGLKSAATSTATAYSACLGQAASTSGRLAIASLATYGSMLRDDPLSGRILWFDRASSPTGTWTTNVTSTSVSNASGANWTKSLSTSSSTTITYYFRIHYEGEAGVDRSRSINWPGTMTTETMFSVTWSSAC